jgi:tetratricopeptide (TPR) repeat protein
MGDERPGEAHGDAFIRGVACMNGGAFDEARSLFEASYEEQARAQQWTQAAQALALLATLERRLDRRPAFLAAADRAIELARAYRLTDFVDQQRLARYSAVLEWDSTGESVAEALPAIVAIKDGSRVPELRVDALLLLANSIHYTKAGYSARKAFAEAEGIAEASAPSKLWWLYLSRARFECALGKYEAGLAYAEKALAIARDEGAPELIDGALQALVELRLDTGDAAQIEQAARDTETLVEALRARGDTHSLYDSLTQKALIHARLGQWQKALEATDEALATALSTSQRERALTMKGAWLARLGRLDEAVAAAVEELASIDAREADHEATAWRDEQNHVEALCQGTAFAMARLERGADALRWLERGRARLLLRELTRARVDAASRDDALAMTAAAGAAHVVDELEGIDRHIRPMADVAVIAFAVGRERAMALVRRPGEAAPRVVWLDVRESHLLAVYATAINSAVAAATAFGQLAALSAWFGAVLEEATAGVDALCIVPDPMMQSIPFAALSLPSGGQVVDRAASFLAPSLAVVEACRVRTPPPRKCLAVSAPNDPAHPEDLEGGARRIAALERATPAQVQEAAPGFGVVHLMCHGSLGDAPDPMTRSRLELGGGVLTAHDVLRMRGLRADLVFLNACVSGRFEVSMRGEVGGFWRAFLAAGARSVVATLVLADPRAAQPLAETFYGEWLGGRSKAQALRRAQIALRERDADPTKWASHVLIGDGGP